MDQVDRVAVLWPGVLPVRQWLVEVTMLDPGLPPARDIKQIDPRKETWSKILLSRKMMAEVKSLLEERDKAARDVEHLVTAVRALLDLLARLPLGHLDNDAVNELGRLECRLISALARFP